MLNGVTTPFPSSLRAYRAYRIKTFPCPEACPDSTRWRFVFELFWLRSWPSIFCEAIQYPAPLTRHQLQRLKVGLTNDIK